MLQGSALANCALAHPVYRPSNVYMYVRIADTQVTATSNRTSGCEKGSPLQGVTLQAQPHEKGGVFGAFIFGAWTL